MEVSVTHSFFIPTFAPSASQCHSHYFCAATVWLHHFSLAAWRGWAMSWRCPMLSLLMGQLWETVGHQITLQSIMWLSWAICRGDQWVIVMSQYWFKKDWGQDYKLLAIIYNCNKHICYVSHTVFPSALWDVSLFIYIWTYLNPISKAPIMQCNHQSSEVIHIISHVSKELLFI